MARGLRLPAKEPRVATSLWTASPSFVRPQSGPRSSRAVPSVGCCWPGPARAGSRGGPPCCGQGSNTRAQAAPWQGLSPGAQGMVAAPPWRLACFLVSPECGAPPQQPVLPWPGRGWGPQTCPQHHRACPACVPGFPAEALHGARGARAALPGTLSGPPSLPCTGTSTAPPGSGENRHGSGWGVVSGLASPGFLT